MSDSRVRAIIRAAQSGDADAWGVIEQALARVIPDEAALVKLLPPRLYVVTGPSTSIHRTEEEAYLGARKIMRRNWREVGGRMPKDTWDVIGLYNV